LHTDDESLQQGGENAGGSYIGGGESYGGRYGGYAIDHGYTSGSYGGYGGASYGDFYGYSSLDSEYFGQEDFVSVQAEVRLAPTRV
jgi:hypothetical protein